MMGRCGLG